uniref:Gamma interferon inducible lysosomal thiol reductase n=1 Tax=Meloidogyne floridensis TaxID=298350 RepID=A0A915P253_9BILA
MHLRHYYRHQNKISRPLFYLLLFILAFLFLIWWNSLTENVVEMPHRQRLPPPPIFKKFRQNSKFELDENNQMTFKEEPDNPPPPPLMPVAVPPPKKANVVQVTIYMEAQCPDTTGFIRRQLLPSWSRLSSTRRLNITLVPFGKASCVAEEDDYKCDCQHGKDECELNQLMNCAIEHLPDPESHIPLIGCVQGKDNLIAAFRSCLNGHSSSDL